ncbi:glucose-6-phosphate isomerase [Marinobacter lutaoensis]|jgi:glucose-6-phosphate isomerase|uniref:Glucose-6-phosphate isomerase n=1 Tax=Marinobacter lutaoensis TaxID=135739 RepID=A0A1V2DNY0_9GAMM|nr:glucose-6-phosphate isomerase [Marinobacter lutaoensis]MBI43514.1 glucose-6-phosphate isomerase [Oceanospirillales bacterium]NVD36057.1 glucose-6-phosphate isomerase [Marinobacter lutaoensis]ONF42358.1 glucose-6-phosphate isomerase [Marinobacter lutaoensis]|tara:strand:- start:980 stop:2641 length:1662 start_codon:yes stop_codon:yes gene_type:complete
MTDHSSGLTSTEQWQALARHRDRFRDLTLRQLFREDPDRASRYFIEAAGLGLDFSKNLITDETLALLVELAQRQGLESRRRALLSGQRVNCTEDRPALHTALRVPGNREILVDGVDVVAEVGRTLDHMARFVDAVLGQRQTGFTGQAFTDVVSIGIGGSYLGPKLVTEALQPYWHGAIRCHYVANIDGTDICETLKQVRPETTLFLIQSKSFRTQETLENAKVARQWFLDNGGHEQAIGQHFLAVTANTQAATAFGMDPDNVFPMWDWVGGRYSLWSAIGLPVALTVGMEHFRALLAGAHAMDRHFEEAPLTRNLPVVLGLLSVWYNNFWGAETHAILPYDQYLRSLPDHLQQLDMESNGKRVTLDGCAVDYQTGPVLWGGVGSNGQHAYHQLIHQGTRLIPADFIIPLTSHHPVANHHADLFANCLSQSRAMMTGKTLDEARAELAAEGLDEASIERLAPHKVVPGNKPSNTLIMDRLTPETVGALIALYEHRTFVQGVIWDVNSFDQWGVELGKQLGKGILAQLESPEPPGSAGDTSTDQLIARFRSARRP